MRFAATILAINTTGLGQGYPHANDRLHKFIVEASRSLTPEVEKRGIRCINYVERPEKYEKGLVYRLGQDAAAIFTDDVPASISPVLIREKNFSVNISVNFSAQYKTEGRKHPPGF